ncbi:MAG: hypothetical protein ACM3SU_08695 [Acidobacteriota bacterium]
MEPNRKRRIVKLVTFVVPMFFLFLAVLVWAVYALWNSLMPPIFAVRAITYWQALGLMVLSWILFRGFRGPSMVQGRLRHNLRERLGRMTPAEREEFARGLRSRWQDTRERWEKMAPAEREQFMKGLPHLWQDMLERWGKMTPAERDEFVRGLRDRPKSPEAEPKA